MPKDPRISARRRTGELAVAIALGTLGGAGFEAIGLPGGWLAGAALFVAAGAILGAPVSLPPPLLSVTFVALGVSMGAGVTPEAVARLADWPLSIAILVVTVVAVTAAVQLFLIRVAGWDRDSALFGALPGALSYVIAAAASHGIEVRRVAISQSVRVLFLIAILPIAVGQGQQPVPPATGPIEPGPIVLLVGASAAAGWLMQRLRMPAGLLTGAFFVSAALHGSGIVAQALPMPVTTAAFILLGTFVGTRFRGVTPGDFMRLLASSLGALAVGLSVSVAGAAAAVWATGLGWPQVLLAFAPGGLDAMIGLAYLLHADPAFVAVHQLIRFGVIAMALPFAVRWLQRTGT